MHNKDAVFFNVYGYAEGGESLGWLETLVLPADVWGFQAGFPLPRAVLDELVQGAEAWPTEWGLYAHEFVVELPEPIVISIPPDRFWEGGQQNEGEQPDDPWRRVNMTTVKLVRSRRKK